MTNRQPPSVRAVLQSQQTPAAGHVIVLDHLTKKFGDRGFSDVSFAVHPGEFVFITGPTGEGKTTLLRLIQGKMQPDSGDIIIGGYGLQSIDRTSYRRKVGFVSQTVDAIDRQTVTENIAYPLHALWRTPKEIKARVNYLLQTFRLEHARDRLCDEQELSGGERQRMAIARAIAHEPDLLLVDEPTSNLDEITTYEVLKTLNHVAMMGTTVLCVTHDPTIVNLMKKRVIVIRDGGLSSDTIGGYRLQ